MAVYWAATRADLMVDSTEASKAATREVHWAVMWADLKADPKAALKDEMTVERTAAL